MVHVSRTTQQSYGNFRSLEAAQGMCMLVLPVNASSAHNRMQFLTSLYPLQGRLDQIYRDRDIVMQVRWLWLILPVTLLFKRGS